MSHCLANSFSQQGGKKGKERKKKNHGFIMSGVQRAEHTSKYPRSRVRNLMQGAITIESELLFVNRDKNSQAIVPALGRNRFLSMY